MKGVTLMYLSDFIYRDERLSDHGCIIAYVVTSISNNISAGSEITSDTIINTQTHKISTLNAKYETPIETTFDIIKYDCANRYDEEFTYEELSWFLRWLNSKTDEKFQPIYSDSSYENICYYGIFTSIKYISIGSKIVGLTVTFRSNSPFGYVLQNFNTEINNANDVFSLYLQSDEEGKLYPSKVEIKCKENGDLKIYHSEESIFDKRSTEIKNCSNNEIITLDCENKVITSSVSHPALFNDFNYNWLSLYNNWNNNKNIFTVTLPCEIKIEYENIRKVGIIV